MINRILFAMAIAALAFGAAPRAKGASPTPVATASPEESATPFKREDDLSMPLNTRTPAPSPNEKKNSGADQRSLKSSPTGAPQTMPSSSPNESKGKGKRTIQPLLNSPAPTASPKGETNDAPHNLRPERPVYAPNPPDGRLRTTNKSQTSDEAAGAQPAQQSNESQGGEKGDKGEKGKKGKPGEQAPSPAPNQ